MKKWFTPVALLTTIATYLLIFVGALVRVSGAGLGCPDWPKCFGRWIPPTHVSQLPETIDPASFNIVLAWIEYGNRLIGVAIGLLIFITYILAIVYYRRHKSILAATTAALVLVGVQGWLGGRVVATELNPLVITLHMALAVLIVSLLVYITQKSYYLNHNAEPAPGIHGGLRWLLRMLWLAAAIQIVVGADMRGAIEVLREDLPLAADHVLFEALGFAKYLHFALATAIGGMTLAVVYLSGKQQLRGTVRAGTWVLLLLVLGQILVGLGMGRLGLVPELQLMHLWIGTIFAGVAMSLCFAIPTHLPDGGPSPLRLVQIALPTTAFICFAIATSVLIIRQAHASRADMPAYAFVPDFQFTNHYDEPWGTEQIRGKITVLDFFFTRCPGICPRMTSAMAGLYHDFAQSDAVQFVSISIDPAHDTPSILAECATKYDVSDKRWMFLNGPDEQVVALSNEGLALSAKESLHHSARFVLIDASATIRGYYDCFSEADLKRLKTHIALLAREHSARQKAIKSNQSE
jgi:cytochrome c oxidase assembly protein subunit 15